MSCGIVNCSVGEYTDIFGKSDDPSLTGASLLALGELGRLESSP